MEGIPPARASDNEDVIWALETAESLWKRNARVDAIVWLRRAAEEAAEAGDDDRASSLMVEAAALTEAIARVSAHTRAAEPTTSPPPADDAAGEDVDSLLGSDGTDGEGSDIDDLLGSAVDALAATPDPPAPAPVAPPLRRAPPYNPRATLADDVAELVDVPDEIDDDDLIHSIPPRAPASLAPPTPLPVSLAPPTPFPGSLAPPTPLPVSLAPPTPLPVSLAPPTPLPVSLAPPTPLPASLAPPTPLPVSLAPPTPLPGSLAPPTPAPPDSLPPPTPVPSGDFGAASIDIQPFSEAPAQLITVPPPRLVLAPSEPPPSAGEPEDPDEPSAREGARPAYGAGVTEMGAGALSAMDLANIPALAGASDAQRESLVAEATVILCAEGAEIPDFGLALVLEGEVTASVGERGPVIVHLGEGGILRRRGTFEFAASVHFDVTADDTTVAFWSERALGACLVGVPDVDAALRAHGDRLLAWKCLVTSALATRLHEDVRVRLFGKFTPKALAPGAELIAGGQPVPGILLVGDGSITVDAPASAVIRAGGFVFPDATLSAARAPATARAGREGALVLSADRRTTQELWATEPLLLEILAS